MPTDPKRVKAIFLEAAELRDALSRTEFLESACGGESELRGRVEALLRSHDPADSFLREPAAIIPDPACDETVAFDSASSGGGSPHHEREDHSAALQFLTPSHRPDSLGRIGHYEVLEVLGQGGFGIVFRAFDETLQRVVAVKMLSPRLAATSPARKRFLREARSSAKVRHENVVHVYAVEEQPLPYLVMEFIPGETLQQRLDRMGPLETVEVARLGRQIAEGLAAAHGRGLIHRDIKPANVLIDASGDLSVKITDFGMARAADDASMTQSGIIAGTPMYMAPEQVQGDKLDHRSDLFSLGSVLYTMCSGRPPFRASSTLAVLKRVAEDAARPIPEVIPEVPQWLCDIIARLHAKSPDDRFATAKEVADLLGQGLAAMEGQGKVRSLPVAPAALIQRPELAKSAPEIGRLRNRRWVVAAAVLLAVIGCLGFTEASGVTDLHGTVIRLFSPEGTLVVEVDDPEVSVRIDGSDIVITGAGVKEIRLKPGSYSVEASKDGKVVSKDLVTVTRDQKQIVRVSREHIAAVVGSPEAARVADAAAWERSVSALPAVERAKAVAIRMQELNPGFDGALTPTIEKGVVTGLEVNIDRITDLSPIRALSELTALTCMGSDAFQGQFVNGVRSTGFEEGRVEIKSVGKSRFVDLSPLKGLPLTSFSCVNCDVHDLAPLAGMKLKSLFLGSTSVVDLSPLKGMPLEQLDFSFTKVVDITPLAGMTLTSVGFEATDVSDLSPLKGMALTQLNIGRKVTDLTPLAGMPLEGLYCHESPVSDLSPLKGMPLKVLNCGGTQVSDLSPLKGMTLSILGLDRTRVSDLSPVTGMPLTDLAVNGTDVTDLSPIIGMPLERLQLQGSKVADLSALKDLPLNWLVCDFQPERDTVILRGIPTLQSINLTPAAQFWEGL